MTLIIIFNLKTLHKKVYDDAEDAKRFEIYQKTGAEIVEHNKRFAAGLETYTQGFNELSDLTPEETKNLGGYGPIQ